MYMYTGTAHTWNANGVWPSSSPCLFRISSLSFCRPAKSCYENDPLHCDHVIHLMKEAMETIILPYPSFCMWSCDHATCRWASDHIINDPSEHNSINHRLLMFSVIHTLPSANLFSCYPRNTHPRLLPLPSGGPGIWHAAEPSHQTGPLSSGWCPEPSAPWASCPPP